MTLIYINILVLVPLVSRNILLSIPLSVFTKRVWSWKSMDFPSISTYHIYMHILIIEILFSRFRNAVIEITAVDVGVFEVKGRVLGVALDKYELIFQVRPCYLVAIC